MGAYRADRSGEFGHIGGEFLYRAAEYLADGLNLDQRVTYVGADDPHDTLEIDARELEFIGHRQLCLLDRCCAAHGRKAMLRSDRAVVHRLVNLLGFANVHIEATA